MNKRYCLISVYSDPACATVPVYFMTVRYTFTRTSRWPESCVYVGFRPADRLPNEKTIVYEWGDGDSHHAVREKELDLWEKYCE